MTTIREATFEDVDAVYDLILAIAKYHDQERYIFTSRNELRSSGFGQSPKFGVLLAEVENDIAGYLSYTWNYSIWSGSSYMNIDDVFVWQKYRGQKVGEALMDKAAKVCKGNGCNLLKWEVQKDNPQAIKFYKRLGAEVNIKGVCRWEVD